MEILLFINDNILINISISNFLKSKGYGVISCTSGDEALKLSIEKDFDLVIIDLNLPHYTAKEIVCAIREKDKNIPIVALTSILIDIEEIKDEICIIIPDSAKEEVIIDAIQECLGRRKG